jgi:hypothetical protein
MGYVVVLAVWPNAEGAIEAAEEDAWGLIDTGDDADCEVELRSREGVAVATGVAIVASCNGLNFRDKLHNNKNLEQN